MAGELNELDAKHVDFITAALAQGRKQFDPETAERRVIDAIPTPSSPAAPTAPQQPAAQSSGGVSAESAAVGGGPVAPSATPTKDPASGTTTPVNFTPPPKAANE